MELPTSPSGRGRPLKTEDPRTLGGGWSRSFPRELVSEENRPASFSLQFREDFGKGPPLVTDRVYRSIFQSRGPNPDRSSGFGSLEGENQPGEWICQGSSKREEVGRGSAEVYTCTERDRGNEGRRKEEEDQSKRESRISRIWDKVRVRTAEERNRMRKRKQQRERER